MFQTRWRRFLRGHGGRGGGRPAGIGLVAPVALIVATTAALPGVARAQAAAEPPAAETLQLQTGDGVQLHAVYYPVGAKAKPGQAPTPGQAPSPPSPAAPVVILLHDLGGSSESVAPLAAGLQRRGIAVVAPDLRGHGGSTARGTTTLDVRSLKRSDLEAMGQSRGGRVRQQATVRGDVEATREWIKGMADRGVLDMQRLFVVGSGVGAAVAAAWTVEDAAWPDIASGPQGRDVRGLVLISPAWTNRGFSIAPMLAADAVRRALPVLIVAGEREKDALRIFEQLRRARPAEWYEKRAAEAAPTPNPRKDANTPATLFLLELATTAQGDALAAAPAGPAGDVAALVAGFITTVAPAGG
jgi:alpha-beta hydrolase superfamily lysophospholipase